MLVNVIKTDEPSRPVIEHIAVEASVKASVERAYRRAHPPTYGSIMEPDCESLRLTRHEDGSVHFVLTVREYQGGYLGRVLKGERQIKGLVELTTHRVHFVKSPT